MVKESQKNGKFMLYHLDREDEEYVLSYASFDVKDDEVTVSCYINNNLLRELKLQRVEARRMWKSLMEDGYREQDGHLNLGVQTLRSRSIIKS